MSLTDRILIPQNLAVQPCGDVNLFLALVDVGVYTLASGICNTITVPAAPFQELVVAAIRRKISAPSQPSTRPKEPVRATIHERVTELLRVLYADIRPTSERKAALLELAAIRHASLAPIVVNELSRAHDNLDWLATVVVAAEFSQFADENDRAVVKNRLRQAVQFFCDSGDMRWQVECWSAIRTHASMLSPPEVNVLADYLDVHGSLETRIVTLQAIQNVFHSAPPPEGLSIGRLKDNVVTITRSATQGKTPESGEPAAVAQESICALAALGDPRLADAIQRILRWNCRWFTRQVRVALGEISVRWESTRPATDSTALTRLRTILQWLDVQ
jgi:hypothetical protein